MGNIVQCRASICSEWYDPGESNNRWFCLKHFGVFEFLGVLSRVCRNCSKILPASQFSKNLANRTCGLTAWCRYCFNQLNTNLKHEVLAAYGARCACCAEANSVFLTIDHVNQDGSEHRRQINSAGGKSTYRWLKKNCFPIGFQVLCFNCNHGRFINGGICPHQEVVG